MARKNSEAVASIVNDMPVIEVKERMTLLVDVVGNVPSGYCPQYFHFNITAKLAHRFAQLKEALHKNGVIFDDGNGTHHVDSDADVFRWLLANLESEPQSA